MYQMESEEYIVKDNIEFKYISFTAHVSQERRVTYI